MAYHCRCVLLTTMTVVVMTIVGISPAYQLVVSGQDQLTDKKAPDDNSAKTAETRALSELLRKQYSLRANLLKPELADATPLKVSPALLTWTSSDPFGEWSGDIFVWTAKGRIQLVGCLGSQALNNQKWEMFQELHSLADEPVADVPLDESCTWQIPKTPLATLRFSDVASPAETEGQRLIQMRQLAASFSATMKVNDVDQPLRLLSKPMFRLPGGTAVLDSALFGFVSTYGTDPEAMLLIEARQTSAKYEWSCTPIRFTTREVQMHRAGEEVWRVGKHEKYSPRVIEDAYFWRTSGIVTLEQLQKKPTE